MTVIRLIARLFGLRSLLEVLRADVTNPDAAELIGEAVALLEKAERMLGGIE